MIVKILVAFNLQSKIDQEKLNSYHIVVNTNIKKPKDGAHPGRYNAATVREIAAVFKLLEFVLIPMVQIFTSQPILRYMKYGSSQV